MVARHSARHVSFVLLAEFDIDTGANLTRQFPQPLGVANDQLVAELMIPDGVHSHQEDWTVFMLNQTPESIVEPVIADADSINGSEAEQEEAELLYVLNLVRTKHDKNLRRGAEVKALAICTRHPFIELFKPVLWIALREYFNDPSDDCITRLYDAVNAMDISLAPTLSRFEKLIMRSSERKDVFAEKFMSPRSTITTATTTAATESVSAAAEEDDATPLAEKEQRARTDSLGSVGSDGSSASVGSSAVWVGVAGANGHAQGLAQQPQQEAQTPRPRASLDDAPYGNSFSATASTDSHSQPQRIAPSRDTHFFDTTIMYKTTKLNIRLPLSTFPEEVGDYSLIQLIQTFSSPGATVAGPLHSHLHTNGSLTHPIILLFNALVTGKRIIFLGYGKPAGLVANYVLAACALGSGCGCVFRGFTARAFPYTSLAHEASLQCVPDFIAGVTNPIFETMPIWDVLCNIESGKITVHKDIRAAAPPPSLFPSPPPVIPRSGTIRSEQTAFDDEATVGRKESKDGGGGSRDFIAKSDNLDNVFMEDVISAISYHYGESHVRTRLTEYASRFARTAARYEEEYLGSTAIGHPSTPFELSSADHPDGRLGSGVAFVDEASSARELLANASRIEGWRHTRGYEYFKADFKMYMETRAIQGFDLSHQLWRMRHAKNMPDAEVELIMRTLVDSVQTYEQVVELLSQLPPHAGGLMPLSFGLFHQQESVRELTVELLTTLRSYPIGIQFLQSLNHFHKYAYVRQAHGREARRVRGQNQLYPPQFNSRTPSNRSDSSLGG
ncbi:spindle pole body interacting protein [Hysterangium stoloniferum]|nr:spindle pole body interacting protein [Hysterangium stoloniferum]